MERNEEGITLSCTQNLCKATVTLEWTDANHTEVSIFELKDWTSPPLLCPLHSDTHPRTIQNYIDVAVRPAVQKYIDEDMPPDTRIIHIHPNPVEIMVIIGIPHGFKD